MKKLCLLCAVSMSVVLTSCCSIGRSEDDILLGQEVFHLADGSIYAIGHRSRIVSTDFRIAESRGEGPPRWREFLRIDKWEYRYPNHQTKAFITYEIDWYTDCCTGGLCKRPNEVRSGEFQAWWPSGARLAEGTFESKWEAIRTNCAGGAKVRRGVIGPDARFWDEEGMPADRSILASAGVQLEEL